MLDLSHTLPMPDRGGQLFPQTEDGLPVGLQIMAPAMADDRLYNVGAALERALLDRWGHPILEEAPAL